MKDNGRRIEERYPKNLERQERRTLRAAAAYGAGPPFAPVGVVEQVNWIPLESRCYHPERWDGMN